MLGLEKQELVVLLPPEPSALLLLALQLLRAPRQWEKAQAAARAAPPAEALERKATVQPRPRPSERRATTEQRATETEAARQKTTKTA